MKTKEQKILDSARTVALSAETWADLSNALFDPVDGLVAKAYPTREERERFVQTEEYKAVRELIDAAEERTGLVDGATPNLDAPFSSPTHTSLIPTRLRCRVAPLKGDHAMPASPAKPKRSATASAGKLDHLADSPSILQLNRQGPLWQGPEVDGITSSLLSRFVVCRERFRLLTVLGLKGVGRWNHRTGYGDMWHVCEESFVMGGDWVAALGDHVRETIPLHRFQIEEIVKWASVCEKQFSVYVDYYKQFPQRNRSPIVTEFIFDQHYELPSGRVVRLRGKWDGLVRETEKGKASVWLQENKTKGDVDEKALERQLDFDLQTMLYLVAAHQCYNRLEAPLSRFAGPLAGVWYNVVRRPLSGGKGTIVPHKATEGSKCSRCLGSKRKVINPDCPKCKGVGRTGAKPAETQEHFYDRLAKYMVDEPASFFIRWRVGVSKEEVERFKRRFLTPILEQLCQWWDWMVQCEADPSLDPFSKPIHWQHPYGCYNPMDEGGFSEVDEYLATGSQAGLMRTDTLFPELKEDKP